LSKCPDTSSHRRMAWQHQASLLACLHDQNKSGFFGRPAFFQPIRAFPIVYRSDWLNKSRPSQKSHFCFDHVNRLIKCFTRIIPNMVNNISEYNQLGLDNTPLILNVKLGSYTLHIPIFKVFWSDSTRELPCYG